MAGDNFSLELYENLRRDLRDSERILRNEFTEADRELRRELTSAIRASNEMHSGRFDKIDETLSFQNELLITRQQVWPKWRRDMIAMFLVALTVGLITHFIFHVGA